MIVFARLAAAGRALLGIKSPTVDLFAEGFREGLATPLRPSDAECVAALRSLINASERLKKARAGEAGCRTADVRWIGRDIARSLRVLVDSDDRWAVWESERRASMASIPTETPGDA